MTSEQDPQPQRGRQRDRAIDARILHAARRQLSCVGYEAMSLAAVAQEACTTRQALYRRWPDKAKLAADAVCSGADPDAEYLSDDPRADLERELANFATLAGTPGQLSLAGTMLQEGTDPHSRSQYGKTIVAPRLERIRVILERAKERGLIEPTADLEVAVTLPTGAWYERQLAALPAPADWAQRTASLVWRAVGGKA